VRTHLVAIDEQLHHVALPALYGAPAYARPAPIAAQAARPFDPDDLPIEAVQTDEEREILAGLPARSYAAGGAVVRDRELHVAVPSLQPRPLSLKALAGRILGQADN
jgi:hypothetical protein